MRPKHKVNGGCGATLCNNCNNVIAIGHTDELLCRFCKGANDLGKFDSVSYELIKEFPGSEALGTVHKYPIEVAGNTWLGTETYDKFPEFWKRIDDGKKFLFKTEDQIDIYEGDTYYAVINDKEIQENSSERYFFARVKKFKSLENAKSYLFRKVKVLTFDEIIETWLLWKIVGGESFEHALMNKIKSKI